jgi:putative membrane protein
MAHLLPFLLHWAVTALSLWVAGRVFKGLRFDSGRTLLISALLLGLANAVVRPILVVLTLPLTLLTFGLFLLVINALMLMLVARLVRGFTISGFGTALFASLFVAFLSLVIGSVVSIGDPGSEIQLPQGSVWL